MMDEMEKMDELVFRREDVEFLARELEFTREEIEDLARKLRLIKREDKFKDREWALLVAIFAAARDHVSLRVQEAELAVLKEEITNAFVADEVNDYVIQYRIGVPQHRIGSDPV
jgi:hypothetical protein